MGRFANSWQTVKASWNVLQKDKELVLFPIFSGIASILVVISFVAPTAVSGLLSRAVEGSDQNASTIITLLYFAMYLTLAFVTIYFNAALISGANERLAGGDPTIRSSLRGANARLGKIFLWAMFAGTVSLLIHLLQSAARQRNNIVGQILASIVGTAWALLTFFAIPVVLFEDKGVFASLKRSGQMFKQTWGETLVGQFGIGLVFGIFSFLIVLATAFGIYASVSLVGFNLPLVAAIAVSGIILLLLVTIVGSALGAIYKVALYRFAAERQVSPGFPAPMIEHAYSSRNL